jgi:hypothetical protein
MERLTYVAIAALVGTLAATGCATPRNGFLLGAGVGATAVGGTAMVFSPNRESLGLNGVIFGLGGALVGGLVGLFLTHEPIAAPTVPRLQQGEMMSGEGGIDLVAPASGNLPSFVKDRLQPVVIEEIDETDSLSEDGSLHEPHKVYRIKRPAELFARPPKVPQTKAGGNAR